MYARDDAVTELAREECWRRLRSAEIGRLATGIGRELEIFPITFRCDGRSLFFRTSPGSKLTMMSINPWVVVEIDGSDDDAAWSVVAKGSARYLRSRAELEIADSLDLVPWIPGVKPAVVRIDVEQVTGRTFARADRTPLPEAG
jgi:nitroimidazol reductase NimA-like FMN-containing flavoprotein (pyridoxamine 5'-phosphate oxidase superfamily)